jgi:hypothetical protein
MQSLLELNAILAHQPWLANKDNIAVTAFIISVVSVCFSDDVVMT